jgi:hypothetical protein
MNKIKNVIYLIFPISYTIIGTIGNLISIAVFFDKRFRSSSVGSYNICILVMSICILYVEPLKYFFEALMGTNPINKSKFWCVILSCFHRPLGECVSWIQILLTFDLYQLIHNSKQNLVYLREKRFQVLILLALLVFFFSYQIPVAIYYGHYLQDNSTQLNQSISFACLPKKNHYYVYIFNDIGNFLFLCFLPFVIMCYLCYSMSKALIQSKAKLRTTVHKNSKKLREYRFAYSILAQNILFVVLLFPISCLVPVLSLKNAGIINVSNDISDLLSLLNAIFNVLIWSYFAFPVLYHLKFNHLFRKILREWFARNVNQNQLSRLSDFI